MILSLFPRLATLALYLLTSGFLAAASNDPDAFSKPTKASTKNAVLIPYEDDDQETVLMLLENNPSQGIPLVAKEKPEAFLILQQDRTQKTQPAPKASILSEEDPLLSALEKKVRDGKDMLAQQAREIEAMKKRLAAKNKAEKEAQDVEAQLAQQAQEMADLMALLNPPVTPPPAKQTTPVPQIPETASVAIPQATLSIPPSPSDIVPEIARGYEDIYRRFLGGKLIYTDPSSKAKKELLIRALSNPLEGTFDLSGCGDTGQYLSISTGYRKAQKAENASKVEIWLAPWFLVNKNLSTTARHLQPIMGNWDAAAAPVGLFWTWGGYDNLDWFDYLVTNSMDLLGSEDLYEKYKKSHGRRRSLA